MLIRCWSELEEHRWKGSYHKVCQLEARLDATRTTQMGALECVAP